MPRHACAPDTGKGSEGSRLGTYADLDGGRDPAQEILGLSTPPSDDDCGQPCQGRARRHSEAAAASKQDAYYVANQTCLKGCLKTGQVMSGKSSNGAVATRRKGGWKPGTRSAARPTARTRTCRLASTVTGMAAESGMLVQVFSETDFKSIIMIT